MAINMTDCVDGFLHGKSHLIMDNDTRFSEAFCKILTDIDVEPVKIAPGCPNMNAHMERFFRSLKGECLNKMIFFGEDSLRHAVREYLKHYNTERNHQGMSNRLLVPLEERPPDPNSALETVERLGGLLKHYRRAA